MADTSASRSVDLHCKACLKQQEYFNSIYILKSTLTNNECYFYRITSRDILTWGKHYKIYGMHKNKISKETYAYYRKIMQIYTMYIKY